MSLGGSYHRVVPVRVTRCRADCHYCILLQIRPEVVGPTGCHASAVLHCTPNLATYLFHIVTTCRRDLSPTGFPSSPFDLWIRNLPLYSYVSDLGVRVWRTGYQMKKRYPLSNKSKGGGWKGVESRNPLYPYFTGWLMLCYLSSDQRAQWRRRVQNACAIRYVPACLYTGRQIRKLSITQASACRGQSRQFQSTCVYTEHVKHTPLSTRGGSRTIVTSLPYSGWLDKASGP